MSIFNAIGTIFKPIADLVDNVHTSEEERGQIRTKLAEIEYQMATKVLSLQSKIVESNAKIAISEQQFGNLLSKSWRPLVSLIMAGMLVAMSLEAIPFNNMLATLAGGFLGIYTGARSYEKRK